MNLRALRRSLRHLASSASRSASENGDAASENVNPSGAVSNKQTDLKTSKAYLNSPDVVAPSYVPHSVAQAGGTLVLRDLAGLTSEPPSNVASPTSPEMITLSTAGPAPELIVQRLVQVEVGPVGVPIASSTNQLLLDHAQASRVQRLRGIETLSSLESLHVAGAQHLHDLGSLSSNTFRLMEMRHEACGAVITLEDIADQIGIRGLWVANCGSIESLQSILLLRDLELLYWWESTRNVDDDLAPLLQLLHLHDLRLMNRKHLSRNVALVKERLRVAD